MKEECEEAKATDEEIKKEEEEEEETMDPLAYEYIFIIDRSGSMNGSPITLAVQALKLFLHSLSLGSRFNVYSFGSRYSKLFDSSVEYNEANLEQAIKSIQNFRADMGGTEILSPIKDILQ